MLTYLAAFIHIVQLHIQICWADKYQIFSGNLKENKLKVQRPHQNNATLLKSILTELADIAVQS